MDCPKQLLKLHPDAKIISFEHKLFILQSFSKNIQGMLGIDYFSLMIVDTENVVSLYSTCPSLECNLITDNLWEHDGIFKPENHKEGAFYFWDELYPPTLKKTLIKEKETNYGFQFGFCVMKQLGDIFVIYSYATKSTIEKELFRNSKDLLFKIEDCLFNELKSVHCRYVTREDKEDASTVKRPVSLKLVIDNTKSGV